MARTLASLLVRLEGDDRNLSQTFDRAKKNAVSFSDFANQASGTILAIGAAAIGAGTKLLTMSGNAEQTRVSFEVFTGSASKARKLLEELNRDSIPSPFTPEAYQGAAKTLLGFGDSLENVRTSLRDLGEAAAATGARDLSGLSLVYGQIIAQQKAYTQDLNQFINQGIPIFDLLADVMQRPKSEIKALAAEGKITSDVIVEAFNKAASAGGRFEGAMLKQSQTLNGLLSILKGNLDLQLRSLGDTLLPGAKVAVEELNKQVDIMSGELQALYQDGTFDQIAAGLVAVASGIGIMVRNMIAGTGITRGFANVLQGDFGEAIQAFGEPFANLGNFADDLQKFSTVYDDTLAKLTQARLGSGFASSLDNLTDKLNEFETSLGGGGTGGGGGGGGAGPAAEAFVLKLEDMVTRVDLVGTGLTTATERANRFAEAMAGAVISTEEFLKKTNQPLTGDPLGNISSLDQAQNLFSAGDPLAPAEFGPQLTTDQLAAMRQELILNQEAAIGFGEAFGNAFAAIPDLIGSAIANAKSFSDVWKTVGQGLKQIFKQLLADIIKLILRTLILKLITAAITGGAGAAAPGAGAQGLFSGFGGGASSLLGSGALGKGIEIFGQLSGSDLLLSNRRTGSLFNRIGG